LNKYLSLEPEDAEQVPERIKQLKEARRQAQLREGRGDAKLLWKRPLVWAGFMIVAVLSFWLFQPDSPLMTALSESLPTQEVVERVVVATQVPPTPTPEPLPYKWTRVNSLSFAQRDSVKVIVVDPYDKEVIYIGMEWAGLYKSINGGISWQPIQEGLGRAQTHSIIINPQDSNIIYAGTRGGGVYKSTNGGESWEQKNNGIYELDLGTSSIHLDPQDYDHLLFYSRNNLYETFNGGENWIQIRLDNNNCPYEGSSAFISPLNPETIIFIESKNYRDGCEPGVYVWQGNNNSRIFSPIDFRISNEAFIDVDHLWHFQDGSLIASVETDDLIISHDDGITWDLLMNLKGKCRVIQPVLSQPGVFYCGKDNDFFRIENYGLTWKPVYFFDTDGYNLSIEEIYINPEDPDHIMLGGKGFFVSNDGGKSWKESSNGLGASKFNLVSDQTGENLFLEDQYFAEYFYSEDYGLTWDNYNKEGYGLAFDANEEYVYRLIQFDNKMLRFSNSNPSIKTEIPIPIMNDPRINANRFIEENIFLLDANHFVDQKHEIYFSEDGGENWFISNGLDAIDPVISGNLDFGSKDGKVIYIGGIARSSDGGKSWSGCGEQLDLRGDIAIDPQDSNHLYAVSFGGGVYVSNNGCKNWKPINNGLGNLYVNSIVLDIDDSNILYAGTDNGFYISYNAGENWAPVNEGFLGGLVINSVYISSIDHTVFAVTPLGIFRLENK
jgi:photosystem II stability/assembly factor-like uncharacterized protein